MSMLCSIADSLGCSLSIPNSLPRLSLRNMAISRSRGTRQWTWRSERCTTHLRVRVTVQRHQWVSTNGTSLPCQARAGDPEQLALEAHSYMGIRDCAGRRKQACSRLETGRLYTAYAIHDQLLTSTSLHGAGGLN